MDFQTKLEHLFEKWRAWKRFLGDVFGKYLQCNFTIHRRIFWNISEILQIFVWTDFFGGEKNVRNLFETNLSLKRFFKLKILKGQVQNVKSLHWILRIQEVTKQNSKSNSELVRENEGGSKVLMSYLFKVFTVITGKKC